MQSSALIVQTEPQPIALRDVASVIVRHKKLLSITFFSILGLTLALMFLLPNKFESSAKLLVERARADVPITPQRVDTYRAQADEVSEADLDSEMALLRTNDILHQVVLKNGLAGPNPSQLKIDKAVERLNKQLQIDPIKKSNIIGLNYESKNPQLSANVLKSVIALYMDKLLQVRHSNRDYQFFDQQAQLYKAQLAGLEKQIADSQSVAPQLTRDTMVGKRADLRAAAAETDADIAEARMRIASLEKLEKSTPQRLVTEQKTSDNPQLLQNLKGTLLSLELQRDQLLAKYQPTYRPVLELDKKIADTKASIASEESRPLREETTNQNTAFEWIRTELAKAQAQLQGLRGRQQADASILSAEDQNLHRLNVSSVEEQELARAAKTAETNYLLYSQKREEARISDALDARRILNVVVVQQPFVPAAHVHQRAKIGIVGMFAAILLSIIAVLVADFFDPRFRSVHEVASFLNVPVLATIPGPIAIPVLEAGVPSSEEGVG